MTGSDIKNCIYCERVVYFSKVMRIQPVLWSQHAYSAIEHRVEERNEGRRVSTPLLPNVRGKHFNYRITSERLMASAVIDCVLEDGYGRLVPVEYKGMRSKAGKAYSDHKYQIAFYAILLEDVCRKACVEGYIHYTDTMVRVYITDGMKMYVKRLISRIRRMVEDETLPPIRVSRRKCNGGCGYRYICYGY
ncbi:MAG: CRISPR-associated protein Cas4 [Candidatus Nitrosocaldus sp.]|nr:CRISPR-associated protein Cas4 [Candidatus Nitrosocaldus sp.]MDW8000798.1 CRISPR-associated protein Cas4 [Candidatus Nitrosocaldus sp.]